MRLYKWSKANICDGAYQFTITINIPTLVKCIYREDVSPLTLFINI